MPNNIIYFDVTHKAATVLGMKFVEIIISYINKEDITDHEIITKNLNERKLVGIYSTWLVMN